MLDLLPNNFKRKLCHLSRVFVEVALSRDQQMLSINCSSRTTSEVLLVDVATSHLRPFLVQRRQLGLLYHVEHWRGRLIILASTGPGQEYQVLSQCLVLLYICMSAGFDKHLKFWFSPEAKELYVCVHTRWCRLLSPSRPRTRGCPCLLQNLAQSSKTWTSLEITVSWLQKQQLISSS